MGKGWKCPRCGQEVDTDWGAASFSEAGDGGRTFSTGDISREWIRRGGERKGGNFVGLQG